MSRRLMALSWLSVFVVAGLLGHLTAQKLHATPSYGSCPHLYNGTNCPSCAPLDPPIDGYAACSIQPASYKTCEPSYPTTCSNSLQFTCSGVPNTKSDCTGMNNLVGMCTSTVYRCGL